MKKRPKEFTGINADIAILMQDFSPKK